MITVVHYLLRWIQTEFYMITVVHYLLRWHSVDSFLQNDQKRNTKSISVIMAFNNLVPLF